MSDKNSKVALIAIVLFAFFISLFVLLAKVGISTRTKEVWSESGVFDLRSLFSENDTFQLRGSVEYILDALLTPTEFAAREDEALFGEAALDSQNITSRTLIFLPDNGYYTFYRKSIGYAHRIYANGQLVLQIGSPGETKEGNISDTGNVLLYLKAEDGVIELVQQVANFVHREGEGHSGWRVSTRNPRTFLVYEITESIMIGSFLALFIVHLILYILLRSYRANLYFSLFCLIWLLRTGVTGSKIFTDIIPWMPWIIKFRIEYMTVPATAVLFVLLLDLLFQGILHKWYRYAVVGVSALFVGIFLVTDTVFMSYAMLWCEAAYIGAILYIIVRIITKLRSINAEQSVFLAGGIIFFFTAIYDISYYNNFFKKSIIVPQDLSSASMLILIFYQAIAVFIVTVREMKKTTAENATLKERERLKEEMMYLQHGLSKREKDIAILLVNEGLGVEEVSERLYISTHTAKSHIARIYRKFKVKNRGEFMAIFVRKDEV